MLAHATLDGALPEAEWVAAQEAAAAAKEAAAAAAEAAERERCLCV